MKETAIFNAMDGIKRERESEEKEGEREEKDGESEVATIKRRVDDDECQSCVRSSLFFVAGQHHQEVSKSVRRAEEMRR